MKAFDSIEDFYNKCLCCISVQDVAIQYNLSRRTVNRYLNILQEYDNAKYRLLQEMWMEKFLNRKSERESKVDIPPKRCHTLNDKVFDILTNEGAYWLGFIASDGNVHKTTNRLTIGLQEGDINHLSLFIQYVQSTKEIKRKVDTKNGKSTIAAYVSIDSKYLKNRLAAYGIVPAKSNLDIDYLSYIPDEYKLYFIFGYLDGDGHISKIDRKPNRPVISIIGNNQFINHCHDFLLQQGYVGTVTKDLRYGVPKYIYTINRVQCCYNFLNQYLLFSTTLERKRQLAQQWTAKLANCNLIKRSNKASVLRECAVCGKITRNLLVCSQECSQYIRRKVPRPSKDELLTLILTMPMTQIGKMYGVSDNAIRRWLRAYGLPTKRTDIIKIQNT